MKINFLINLVDRLDDGIIKSWDEAVENYLDLIQKQQIIINDLDFDFFSIIYLISEGDSGTIIDEYEDYHEEIKSELKKVIDDDEMFNITINSDKNLIEQSKDLGKVLYKFYKETNIGIIFLGEYIYNLVYELLGCLYLTCSTEEEIYNYLGEHLLKILRKYNLI